MAFKVLHQNFAVRTPMSIWLLHLTLDRMRSLFINALLDKHVSSFSPQVVKNREMFCRLWIMKETIASYIYADMSLIENLSVI